MTGDPSERKSFDPEAYWQERLSQTYDFDGVGHMGLGRSYNRWLYRVRRYNFRRIVGKHDLGDSPSVLDIGSGTGFYVDLWEEIGAEEIVGVDIADVAVENLTRRYPDHKFVKGDISEPLPEEIGRDFDVISAMDVLFHIVDDERYKKALLNVCDLMKPGGIFLFSGNFLHSETKRSEHIVHRSLEETRHVLKEIGFEAVDRQPVFVAMNQPVDSPSTISKSLWKRIYRFASRSDLHGKIAGAFLFPFEIMLSNILSESPTTEIMLCKKERSF